MLLYGELSILQDSNMVIGSPDHKQNHQNKKLKPTNKDCIGLKYKKQQLQK